MLDNMFNELLNILCTKTTAGDQSRGKHNILHSELAWRHCCLDTPESSLLGTPNMAAKLDLLG